MPTFDLTFRALPWVLTAVVAVSCADGEELPASMTGSGTSSLTGGQAGSSGDPSPGSGGSTGNGSSGSSGSSGTMTGGGGSSASGGSNASGGSSGAAGSNAAGGSGGSGSGGKGGASNSGGGAGTSTVHDAGSAGSGSAGSGNLGSCSLDGGPSGVMLLSEDFEDGTANGWNATVPAEWSVVDDGGKVYKQSVSQGNSTVHLSAAGDVGWSNVVIEAKVKPSFGGSSSSYFAGVCARLKDADDFYCAALRSDGKFGIRARLGGNGTNLSNAINVTPTPITTDKWYTVKLVVQGSNLQATVTGPSGETATATAADCQIPNGGVGLAAAGMSAEFDDVKVTTP